MTKQQLQAGTALCLISTGIIVFGMLINTKLNENQLAANAYPDLPEFTLLERNFATDTAIISVKTNTTYSKKTRQLTKYLVETYVQPSKTSAAIFIYSDKGKLKLDEPKHKFTWKENRGYSMQY